MHRSAGLLAAASLVAAFVASGCGYIVTPDDGGSTGSSAPDLGWAGLVTKVAPSGSSLVVEVTIRNDTGDWSEMHAVEGKPATLTAGGHSTECAKVFVGTGGNRIAAGFQIRGYTGGTKYKPATQMLSVECAGASATAGATLDLDYSYIVGDFNYYLPTKPITAHMQLKLDAVASGLVYPGAAAVTSKAEKTGAKIAAINNCTLTLASATRTPKGLELAWESSNPTQYPVYLHIGEPPVVGTDGIIYGFYTSPHLTDPPITPAGQTAQWTTTVTVPAEATGLFVLASVESKQQKTFVGHLIDISDK